MWNKNIAFSCILTTRLISWKLRVKSAKSCDTTYIPNESRLYDECRDKMLIHFCFFYYIVWSVELIFITLIMTNEFKFVNVSKCI